MKVTKTFLFSYVFVYHLINLLGGGCFAGNICSCVTVGIQGFSVHTIV